MSPAQPKGSQETPLHSAFPPGAGQCRYLTCQQLHCGSVNSDKKGAATYGSGKCLFKEQGLEMLLSHLLRALQKPQDRNQFFLPAWANSQRDFLHLSQALDCKTLDVPRNLLTIHRRANSANTTSGTSEVLQTLAQVLLWAGPGCFPQPRVPVAGSRFQIPPALLRVSWWWGWALPGAEHRALLGSLSSWTRALVLYEWR